MRIWPVIIDSKPPHCAGLGRHASLLLAPLGAELVVDYIVRALAGVTSNRPLVLPPDQASPRYPDWILAACPKARVVAAPDEFASVLAEPSDALLVIDPRCLPIDGYSLVSLLRQHARQPKIAHHLVAFDQAIDGTKEYLSFDSKDQIRGIQRYYERVTWPFIGGVAACALPNAALVGSEGTPPCSLMALRLQLIRDGVPSRDIPISGRAMNLAEEQGLLSASEQSILLTFRQLDSGQKRPMLAGMGQKIHPSVRLMGAVIVHNGVTIDAGATVLGPAVIGSGARIGAGAVVAHSTIGPDSIVPPDTLVRDRAWFRGAAENGFGGSGRPLISFADRLKRVSLDTEPPAAVEWQTPPKDVRYQHGKRACDVLMAIAGLFVFSPAFVLAALAIWLESRGPIFFGDSRETVGGRVFKCWKFRTMLTGAHLAQRELKALDQIDGPHFKMDHDPRVTRVGKVLRALNLDEIPQLVNVLVGDMSLVGPRPSPFRENQVCVPWRAARLSVRPGITGFWQVCRHDRAAGDFHQWIEYDLLYIQHQSLWLDMKILAATLLTFGGKLKHVDALWLVSDSDTDAVVPAMSQPVPSQSQKAEREQVA